MTAETATAPTGEQPEVDETAEILQEPYPLEIRGVGCEIARLKTREFLVLTRIITTGVGGRLELLNFDPDDEEVAIGQMGALLVGAIPYAADEVMEFIRIMVKPKTDDPKEYEMVRKELENPDLDVMTKVVQKIAENEAANLVGLGKAFAAWWKTSSIPQQISGR